MINPGFVESAAKETVRGLLRQAAEKLGRVGLTYLGLPGESAADVRLLASVLENAICVERDRESLAEARRSIAMLALKQTRFVCADMWQYLRDTYPAEALVADITFLDFYAGGIKTKDPFSDEIHALRNYFTKQARLGKSHAFVLAWTYMPRDYGREKYLEVAEKITNEEALLERLRTSPRSIQRSQVVRLLLWQTLREHNMSARIIQHAIYKKVMNAIILVYAKGQDPKCAYQLDSPDSLLTEAAWSYEAGKPVPTQVPILLRG